MIQWVDPDGFRETLDPLIAQDTFVWTGYLTFDYLRLKNLNIYNKVKYDWFSQRNEQAEVKDNRLFFGRDQQGGLSATDYRQPVFLAALQECVPQDQPDL